MKYFFDTEFIEDGRVIDLVSIGVVAEDGREFYRCNTSCKLHLASPWVRENVLPSLPGYGDAAWVRRGDIGPALVAFVGADTQPEFWAYYADYDWVAMCQLFGTMVHLPRHFPRWCRDLKQLSADRGSPKHPEQSHGIHNALDDARWNVTLYRFLIAQEKYPNA